MKGNLKSSRMRRELLRTVAALPVAYLAGRLAPATAQELELTRACGEASELTPPQVEGPFFKPRTPQRQSLLEPGVRGDRLIVSGVVLSPQCQPVAGALLDFWHCDDEGEYDNRGMRLRGHQFTDSAGRYRLETVMPGIYPGRTRHIHVKVQAPNQRVLTTQLYFPGEPGNERDFEFHPALIMNIKRAGADVSAGRFDFVVRA